MPESFEINSYDEIIRNVDDVLAWLESLKADIVDSRLADYRKTVTTLNDAVKKGMVKEFKGDPAFRMVCDSFFELSVISKIHEELKDEKAYPPVRRLRLVTKGPSSSIEEEKSSPNRQARDTQFELLMLAFMKAQGMTYRPLVANTDVSGLFEERPIVVECKRLWSEERIGENIQSGISQITSMLNHFEDVERPIGLLGLDFTRVVSPPGCLLECASYLDATRRLDAFVEKSLRLHEDFWSKSVDIRFIGVIGYIGAIVVLKDRQLLSAGHRFGVINYCLKDSADYQLLKRLSSN